MIILRTMQMRFRWQLLLAAILVTATLVTTTSGCASSPRYDWAAERLVGYRVGPSDMLKIEVWKHDELLQQIPVRPDGAISMPLIGEVPAAGRTTDQIAGDISQRLAKFFQDKPTVTVSVNEVKSYRVYVVGEVTHAGEFSPTHTISILQALSLAGGFTRYADPDRIVLIRKDARGERRIPFNMTAVIEKAELVQDLDLQSGDVVYVP